MRIRPATPADSQGIAEVHVATWKSAYVGIVAQSHLDSLSVPQRKSRWEEILGTPNAKQANLVAEVEGRIAGFISGGANRDPDLDFEAEILTLYVGVEYQKLGYGAALHQALGRELARLGYRNMLVWVLRDNPSRNFYERMGGRYLAAKDIVIGAETLIEVSYGWDRLG